VAEFINPYTFVPLVRAPERGEPAGHSLVGEGRFSGVLKITLTARTPLLIGGFVNKETGAQELPHRSAPGRELIIPGSSLMGAVRSLHETLAGGCLRVLNTDWVPVHRHPANANETSKAGLRLAVVDAVDGQGVPVSVKLCDEWVWVPAQLLPAGDGRLPRTGDRVEYQRVPGKSARWPEGALGGVSARRTVRCRSAQFADGLVPGDIVRVGDMGQVAGEGWVLLVTDTKARHADQPYFVAGRVGPDAASRVIPPETWKHYRDVIEGADDLRPESLSDTGGKEPPWDRAGPRYKAVCWPPQEDDHPDGGRIAERLPVRSYLYPGQPVWVRVDPETDEVIEIRLSELWRYRGDGPVGERVGDAQPCRNAERLCWSCRVFGSADTEGRDAGDLAVQNSYRGHVRIDDLVAAGEVAPLTWHLAPLGSPRPSAGQFYLDNTGRPRVTKKDARAASAWRPAADEQGLRQIRGRKFYWRTKEPDEGPVPRGRRRVHQSAAMSKDVVLFPAGTRFEGRVCFDNLGLDDYGSLLAALDPRRMAETGPGWSDAVSSLGGGKPFGFGAVTIDVEPEKVQTAAVRYLGENGQQPDQAEAVRAFDARVPEPVRRTWDALRHVLSFGFVPDGLVWYPPGTAPGAVKGDENFDKSFEFFGITTGIELKGEKRQLVALPDAADPAGAQVLDSRGDIQRQGRGRG
jgi:CRISPR-associated protein (TIGR03986 family)